VVIACSIPYDLTQWILIAYAVFSSTSFILVNYWKELSKYMEKKRYLILAIILIFQAGLFLVLKLYFFEKFNAQTGTLNNSTSTNTTSTNTTEITPTNNGTASNSTLLIL
jgi:ABC-type transport system involved in multi-copper enzyme maturation permease subunit